MTPPEVAVVVVCYNLGRTLDSALQSVRQQTLHPSELLTVDDGSTDIYTRQVLARLQDEGHRIVHTPNRGVSAARNLGIRATTAPYIVVLDADDLLDPTYLEKAAAFLEAHRTVSFVSCGMKCFGAADEVWIPPTPDLIGSMVRGVVHVSSMFRREMWQAIGGFDESLHAYEDVDFWTMALERGFEGGVLPEPLLHYRVRLNSNYHVAIQADAHLRLMEQFYRKHAGTVDDHAEELLIAKESFILEQRAHQEDLLDRKRRLEADLETIRRDLHETLVKLRALGHDRVEFGDLRRTSPFSPLWGIDRGMPLDRHYIHRFLDRYRSDVRGRIIEVKDAGYARLFGDDRVGSVDVLDIDSSNDQATIVADLRCASPIADGTYDCFILTQTLGVIYEARAALAEAYRILKPGGVLLCTLPAAGRISGEEGGLDADFWRFTEASARRLFAEVFPVDAFEVTAFGNVLACTAFLYGLGPDELTAGELDELDPFFPVVYGIRAVKPASSLRHPAAPAREGGACPGQASQRPSGAILMYHRIACDQNDRHRLCVTPDDLHAQMQCLRDERYHVMSLRELGQAASRGTLPPRSVAITFDDGYIDALTCASEILAEFSHPATFFIVGETLDGTREYWWHALERIFLSDRPMPASLHLRLPKATWDLPTGTSREREKAHDRVSEAFYLLPRRVRDETLRHILEWSGDPARPPHPARPLTEPELIRLANMPGASIGSHSESHSWLPSEDFDDRLNEVNGAKRRLENVLGRPVTSFAYPFGGYDRATIEMVRQAGFEEAVTTETRPIGPGDDPLLLPRFDVRGWSTDPFSVCLRRTFRGTTRVFD